MGKPKSHHSPIPDAPASSLHIFHQPQPRAEQRGSKFIRRQQKGAPFLARLAGLAMGKSPVSEAACPAGTPALLLASCGA